MSDFIERLVYLLLLGLASYGVHASIEDQWWGLAVFNGFLGLYWVTCMARMDRD